MNKIAFITAIVGNKDKLRHPPVYFNDIDYYCFTDNKLYLEQSKDTTLNPWNILSNIPFSTIDYKFASRRNAKIYKILPELFLPTAYDYYVWCDPTHSLNTHPLELIKTDDCVFFNHKTRNNVFDEANELLNYGNNYDHASVIHDQMNYYKKHTDNIKKFGLYECPILIFHIKNSLKFRLMWWEHICKWSSRDQLSAPICAKTSKMQIKTIDCNIQDVLQFNANKVAQKLYHHGT